MSTCTIRTTIAVLIWICGVGVLAIDADIRTLLFKSLDFANFLEVSEIPTTIALRLLLVALAGLSGLIVWVARRF